MSTFGMPFATLCWCCCERRRRRRLKSCLWRVLGLAVAWSQATYCVAGDVRPCPYAGAKFPVTMTFPPSYPFKVHEVHFLWLVHVFAFSSE